MWGTVETGRGGSSGNLESRHACLSYILWSTQFRKFTKIQHRWLALTIYFIKQSISLYFLESHDLLPESHDFQSAMALGELTLLQIRRPLKMLILCSYGSSYRRKHGCSSLPRCQTPHQERCCSTILPEVDGTGIQTSWYYRPLLTNH